MPRYLPIVALFFSLVPAARAFAQEAPPLNEGFRRDRAVLYTGDVVRITAPAAFPQPFEGRVVGLSTDSLIVRGREETQGVTAVALSSITVLERLDQSTSGIGAVLGVLAGVGGGAALAGTLTNDASNLVQSLAVVGGALVGAFGGYWAGVHVERLITGDKWQPVPLAQLGVSVGPTPGGGLGFVATYRF